MYNTYIHIYIYIYIYNTNNGGGERREEVLATANLSTTLLDFRRLDSSKILILRGGILMSVGSFPESLSQGIYVYI